MKHCAEMVACGDEVLCMFGGYGAEFSQCQLSIYSAGTYNEFFPILGSTNEMCLFHVKQARYPLHLYFLLACLRKIDNCQNDVSELLIGKPHMLHCTLQETTGTASSG